MSNKPRLSVIMPMYNAEAFVEAAVHSVLAQSFGDFEFLIVDDGSTDKSASIVDEIAQQDARIALIRQPSSGIVASLNVMIARAQGHYIARMDADDICLPERFARQIAYLDQNCDVGALGTQFIEIDVNGALRDTNFRHPVGPAAVKAQLLIEQPLGNPTAMFRAESLRAVGGYREAFRYCEDYDLFLRLARVAEIDNLPDVLFHYRRSSGQMSVAHNSMQTRQSVKALFAHREVLAGRPDPFDGVTRLPTLDKMDAHVGRTGVAHTLRREIAERLRYSPAALTGPEFAFLLEQARRGGGFAGSWRTVVRCLSLGLPSEALQLSIALVRGKFSRAAG